MTMQCAYFFTWKVSNQACEDTSNGSACNGCFFIVQVANRFLLTI
jgi:hypothetical protein